MATAPIPRVTAMRYVQPLREGGSLPAVVDTEDGLYVVKFRGAGQGPKALVAELIVALLAERLGLPVPQLALVDLPPPFGRSEPDPEIQDLLRRSHGVNVGLRYLDGAFNFDPTAAGTVITPDFAARVVWLDALVTNPDRTYRNPNLLVWQRRPWLIDHGAALYVHHHWANATAEKTRGPFPLVANHVLLGSSDGIEEVDEAATAALGGRAAEEVLNSLPDELLTGPELGGEGGPDVHRRRYQDYLTDRLRHPRAFLSAAVEAREQLRRTTPPATGGTPVSGDGRVAYDFAVLRVVPHVHLGDFTPIGVILHARTAEFLGMRALRDPAQLRERFPGLDHELLLRYLETFAGICSGDAAAGPIALEPTSERFHWLTSPRSDVLQTSPIHEGLCTDPERALDALYREYVLGT